MFLSMDYLMTPQLIARAGLWLGQTAHIFPSKLVIWAYSRGHSYFMRRLYKRQTEPIYISDRKWGRVLWGLEFRLPLMNAAGMFKNGECYDLCGSQGAGGYIGGTSTSNQRLGNIKLGIKHPFLSLIESHTSINFFGLPNKGDEKLSKKRLTNTRIQNCPIGWSLMRSPDYTIDESMKKLVDSLWLYHYKFDIDFIEINESCPNISTANLSNIDSNGLNKLENRLHYLADNFLSKRERNLPVIIKLSNDILSSKLDSILDVVFACKFDGINIGNTSTIYSEVKIDNPKEQMLFDYFTKNIGGGVGGRSLKDKSLELCTAIVKYKNKYKPNYEFHVIRTGGISSLQDIIDSENAGISLNQWYSGYFENYIKYGDKVYARLFND